MTDVALKQLNSVDQLADFERESATLRSLNHPNIVRFLGIYMVPTGERYICTEFMSKGGLDRLVKQSEFAVSELTDM